MRRETEDLRGREPQDGRLFEDKKGENMLNDFGYIDAAVANIRKVADEQGENIKAAATLMADAIAADRLINVYAGGGHTTLAMGEMFFRAGGLANSNPMMETALSVFNQALKCLALERTVNFGASIVKYYDPQPGDVVLFFRNIGINPATIGPVSNVVDFTIAHLLEIETCRQCVERGIVPPVWNSANAPGGDEKNAAHLKKCRPLVKCL